MTEHTIYKTDAYDGEGVQAFLDRLTMETEGGFGTIVIVIDKDGHPVRIASDNAPVAFAPEWLTEVNEILFEIYLMQGGNPDGPSK